MANETDAWLSNLVKHVGAVAGTVHVRDGDGLRLMSAVNIPDVVKKAVEYVPNGKGMAGIALHSGKPVQTCNLKDDHSGNVRPGANRRARAPPRPADRWSAEMRLLLLPAPAALTMAGLKTLLGNLTRLGDDAEPFADDIRAIRSEFPPETIPWD